MFGKLKTWAIARQIRDQVGSGPLEGFAGVVIAGFIVIIMAMALSSTIVDQAGSAADNVLANPLVNQGAAPIFGLAPLMWAIMAAIAIPAVIVIWAVSKV